MSYDRSPFPEASWWKLLVAAILIAGAVWALSGCHGIPDIPWWLWWPR